MIYALDTESTGLDLYHGARPYLVTLCDGDGVNTWWEWDVEPETRKVVAPRRDLLELREVIDDAELLVLQNAKFDYVGLRLLYEDAGLKFPWDWAKVRDTLLAGHLLASNHPHDLTSMVVEYLGGHTAPYDERLEACVKEARAVAKGQYPTWQLAKRGNPTMPSAKKKVWKYDAWVPRAVAKRQGLLTGECVVVNKKTGPYDIYIGRGSKWGNPYQIGPDGDRRTVLAKYREYLSEQKQLMDLLPELDGKRLGCFCKPLDCHGDILAGLLARLRHPWWTVCSEYANSDSTSTLYLWLRQEQFIEKRGLGAIYDERLKLLPVVPAIEQRGVAVNRARLDELEHVYREESEEAGAVCIGVARRLGCELQLPKGGNNKSLTTFVFGGLGLSPVTRSKKTGAPSLDKTCLDHWLATLPTKSKQYTFIKSLRFKRQRNTSLSYLEGYRRFWVPLDASDWCLLHPSLNMTGTDTLRWSSSNPNEQNISKKEIGGFTLRHCMGPAPGREWWSMDAKNIELRIPAYEANEDEMIALFERPDEPPYYGSYHLLVFDTLHPEKFNLHGAECKEVYADTWYQWTKNGNFAVQYGAVEESGTADRAYHVPGAQKRIQGRFRKIKKLNDRMITYAEKYGYVETMPDRSVDPDRGYPLLCTRNKWDHGVSPTVPLNYHVSGSAMWWMAKAMVRCHEYLEGLEIDAGIVMQVHDELVFDFPRSKRPQGNLPHARILQCKMEQGGEDLGLPTPVSRKYHDSTWSEGASV